jgi:hypothetical protein
MRANFVHGLPLLAALLMGCGGYNDDYDPPQTPPAPPPAPAVQPAADPEPYTDNGGAPATPPPGAAQAPPPAPTAPPPPPPQEAAAAAPAPPATSGQLVYTYPTGSWVFMAERGWVWVPSGTQTVDMEGAPYAYLYTPAYGWTWYLSPWGIGPYHYGVWARHPWHPVGWHGYWVAHPRVVVRLGRGGYYRGGHHR